MKRIVAKTEYACDQCAAVVEPPHSTIVLVRIIIGSTGPCRMDFCGPECFNRWLEAHE